MVAVHAVVHLKAVVHLLRIMPTEFFGDVFEMGELDYDDKHAAIIGLYVFGTTQAWLPDGYSHIFRSYVFGPSGFWTMAPLRSATLPARFDPLLSLDCAPTPSTLAQSKERKGSNFVIWQPCSVRPASDFI